MVTKTLLFGGEGSGGRPLLHAYDKKTGENIAELPMPGNQTGVPMTYMYQNRQFILMAVGGRTAGRTVGRLRAAGPGWRRGAWRTRRSWRRAGSSTRRRSGCRRRPLRKSANSGSRPETQT